MRKICSSVKTVAEAVDHCEHLAPGADDDDDAGEAVTINKYHRLWGNEKESSYGSCYICIYKI